jgi:hypothetical protein
MATPDAPLDFYFALHLHQPVGNFGEVFAQHVAEVYRPLVDALAARESLPVVAHLSGPLLDWCLQQGAHTPAGALLDQLGRLAADGRLELLLAGYYEPILAALPRADRLEQIAWHAAALQRRFGVAGPGLWLTERVWEPDLARDLADAGVRYALVDDRPLLAAGHEPSSLAAVFRTEHDGRLLDLLPIDEPLRYLVPFRPVSDIVADLEARRAAGARLAVFADDAEKFGGWPRTHAWVFGTGWLDAFLDALVDLQARGTVRVVRGPDVLATGPRGGLTYLSGGSYREMEEWALSPAAAARLVTLREELRETLGDTRADGPDGAFVRGTHWKHFLVKYPEANRLHKHMLAVSQLARARGNPTEARRAIGMAQSNDPLWHGVFGGLYLPWLREANWHHLARAEAMLRAGQPLAIERRDLDADGQDEVWVHGAHLSLVIAPHRGFALETWLRLDAAENAADVLTRRVESYHAAALAAHVRAEAERMTLHDGIATAAHGDGSPDAAHGGGLPDAAHGDGSSDAAHDDGSSDEAVGDGAPSIHALEHAHTLDALPPADLDVRSLVQVRAIGREVTPESFAEAAYVPVASWTTAHFVVTEGRHTPRELMLRGSAAGLTLTLTVHASGALELDADWGTAVLPADARIALECSLGARTAVVADCGDATATWRYDLVSRAKSERGLETTVQGKATVFLVPVARGRARVTLGVSR